MEGFFRKRAQQSLSRVFWFSGFFLLWFINGVSSYLDLRLCHIGGFVYLVWESYFCNREGVFVLCLSVYLDLKLVQRAPLFLVELKWM